MLGAEEAEQVASVIYCGGSPEAILGLYSSQYRHSSELKSSIFGICTGGILGSLGLLGSSSQRMHWPLGSRQRKASEGLTSPIKAS